MARSRPPKNRFPKRRSDERGTNKRRTPFKPRTSDEARRGAAENFRAGLSLEKRLARSPQLRRLLEGIGVPPAPAAFTPDPFQLEALARIEHEDVLVTAPTGAGKTWIAREEIRRLLEQGKRAWYTSPLKALTNSKYAEFAQEFGAERVGILTGDRKENADAPLIVGTTEIYRNQLFDALRNPERGRATTADLVILDEAHYLADEERGHVWEEAIILSPPRVRLLLLSATIGNADEFARWIAEVRGTECGVVRRSEGGGARPVPLRAAFLHPEGALAPLTDEAGRFNPEIKSLLQEHEARPRGRDYPPRNSAKMNMPEMPPPMLLQWLGFYNLLPAIVFLPTRRRCDEAAAEAALARGGGKTESEERREARRHLMREFANEHPEVRRHRHWAGVVKGGVAAHHAGHLPAWKLLVERLMSRGLLDAIFATATVAAGVDFPARTVVLSNADARTGRGWRALSASEFQQMTGRAGRRGKDRVGFIVAAPGQHQNPQRLAQLTTAQPDPLESQFRATYTTLLNLLDAYKNFGQVRDIVERSFAYRELAKDIHRLETERDETRARVRRKLDEAGCVASVETAQGLERLASARSRLLGDVPETRREALTAWLDKQVLPGRVVRLGGRGQRFVLVTQRRGVNVIGVREDGSRASFSVERVGRVYAPKFSLAEDERERVFDEVQEGGIAALDEPRLVSARESSEQAVSLINDLIEKVSSQAGAKEICGEALWSVIGEAEKLEGAERSIEALRDDAWLPFERRARVLEHFGYLDRGKQQVTECGRWLADLRLDQPLLVGEAIERGLFAALDATTIAALVAALAADPDRDFGELQLDDKLVSALARFEEVAYEIASVEWRHDLDPKTEMNFSAAAAAASWTTGAKWEDLVRETRAEEGDLFRLLSRTGESLLQIAALRDAHPDTARAAQLASSIVLREPLRFDES
ncbi:MAG: DEAD/DEAH box helicase [Pyrinomonadaceae bacterium]|nr:DEAD/DEAH box helicase [Pyrinomonadaceae bacterium]